VFDNSLGESGVISALERAGGEGKDGSGVCGDEKSHSSEHKTHSRRRRQDHDNEDDDLGDFLDGFDRETATIKSTSASSDPVDEHRGGMASDTDRPGAGVGDVGHDVGLASNHEQQQAQYNFPREGSMVMLDCGSMVSSLNSLGNDEIVTGLLDGHLGGARGGLEKSSKQNVFDFDDRKTSDELLAQAGGVRHGPLLNSMDNKMVSSLDSHEALERLIGSGLYKKATDSPTSSTTVKSMMTSMSRSNISHIKENEDDEEEDLDVFLNGFEEETADMNF
jgi:hypothetical protein